MFHFLPVPASDIEGALSVLKQFNIIVIIYSPGGCKTGITFGQSVLQGCRADVFISKLTNLDFVMGSENNFINQVVDLVYGQSKKYDGCFILSTAAIDIVSPNVKKIQKILEKKIHIPVTFVDTNGYQDYRSGKRKIFEYMLNQRPVIRFDDLDSDTIHLLGVPEESKLYVEKVLRPKLLEAGKKLCLIDEVLFSKRDIILGRNIYVFSYEAYQVIKSNDIYKSFGIFFSSFVGTMFEDMIFNIKNDNFLCINRRYKGALIIGEYEELIGFKYFFEKIGIGNIYLAMIDIEGRNYDGVKVCSDEIELAEYMKSINFDIFVGADIFLSVLKYKKNNLCYIPLNGNFSTDINNYNYYGYKGVQFMADFLNKELES